MVLQVLEDPRYQQRASELQRQLLKTKGAEAERRKPQVGSEASFFFFLTGGNPNTKAEESTVGRRVEEAQACCGSQVFSFLGPGYPSLTNFFGGEGSPMILGGPFVRDFFSERVIFFKLKQPKKGCILFFPVEIHWNLSFSGTKPCRMEVTNHWETSAKKNICRGFKEERMLIAVLTVVCVCVKFP